MSTMNKYLATLGLSQYHLDKLVSEFASFNRPFCIRYGDNSPFVLAIDPDTGSLVKLNAYILLNHIIGRVRVAISPAPLMKFFCLNLTGSTEQVLINLKKISQDFGKPMIFVTKKSRIYSCYYFLRSLVDKNSIVEAVGYCLEKILNAENILCYKTFPGSVKWLELPFGPGCTMLDHTTLEPVKMSKRKMIESYFYHQKMSTLTLDELLHNAEGLLYE